MKKYVIIILIAVVLVMLVDMVSSSISGPKGDPYKARTRREMSFLKAALSLHALEYGKLPDSSLNADILDVLTRGNPRKISFYSATDDAVRDGQLVDGWGQSFVFRKTEDNMIICSAGKDGIHHTKDDLTLEVLTPKSPDAE